LNAYQILLPNIKHMPIELTPWSSGVGLFLSHRV
jgi:hypothetical protein